MDKADLPQEFYEWLSRCPISWFKNYGENIYEFIDDPNGEYC